MTESGEIASIGGAPYGPSTTTGGGATDSATITPRGRLSPPLRAPRSNEPL